LLYASIARCSEDVYDANPCPFRCSLLAGDGYTATNAKIVFSRSRAGWRLGETLRTVKMEVATKELSRRERSSRATDEHPLPTDTVLRVQSIVSA
jgi:hypothetical protein